MVDLKRIRSDPAAFAAAVARKGEMVDLDAVLTRDERRRVLIESRDRKRHEQKELSARVAELRRTRQPAEALTDQARALSAQIKDEEAALTALEQEITGLCARLPNPPHVSVPDADQVLRSWGEKPSFDFPCLAHWDLAEVNKLIDFRAAARLAGARFVVFRGPGARLERALIAFCLDLHTTEHGFTEIAPPYLNTEAAFFNAAQFPRLAADMYGFPEEKMYLIPTAEVPLVNLHAGEMLDERQLPLRYAAYTPCFRRESGSYGKDVRGMIRIHQFDKVELVSLCRPEDSYDELERLLGNATTVLERLEIPHQVKLLGARELAFQSAKTYDIDVWAAGTAAYLEASSVSNCEDFQARRANIRFRRTNGAVDYVHILNGSGVALPRTYIALIENNQRAGGSVRIPAALRPYLGGAETLP